MNFDLWPIVSQILIAGLGILATAVLPKLLTSFYTFVDLKINSIHITAANNLARTMVAAAMQKFSNDGPAAKAYVESAIKAHFPNLDPTIADGVIEAAVASIKQELASDALYALSVTGPNSSTPSVSSGTSASTPPTTTTL